MLSLTKIFALKVLRYRILKVLNVLILANKQQVINVDCYNNVVDKDIRIKKHLRVAFKDKAVS